MEKIKSFTINHNSLSPGFYLNGESSGVFTYDLRFKRPNEGDYLSPPVIHTIEHVLASALRNGTFKDKVVYFGPMGCRTGFNFLIFDTEYSETKAYVVACIEEALKYGAVPGNKKIECGNYRSHNLKAAKLELTAYLLLLRGED